MISNECFDKLISFSEYVELAARTDQSSGDTMKDITVAAMGMVGEAAETLEHVKKVVEQGHELDIAKIVYEMGDSLWYHGKMSRLIRVPLDVIAYMNIEKLRKRYPDGFSVERSVHRSDME
jgi:hypothetical protein